MTPPGSTTGPALAEALLPVYRRPDLVLVRGEGTAVWDEDGRRYLDFTSGLGVNALGHRSSVVREAVEEALDDGLVHTSNLFRTRPAERLAGILVEESFPSRVFFCNSGAEAVEGAFKFARRWARKVGGEGKVGILGFEGSFHGRLFASLAATDRPEYREPFAPLVPGIEIVPLTDLSEVDRRMDGAATAAVIVEPVQGEGGVRPVPPETLRWLRERCDEKGIALIVDEVQCGLGRTGDLFGFQEAGIRPDLLALAKPLGGGLPMGAVVVGSEVAEAVEPGDHATTFGGGPLVARVATAVLETLRSPDFRAEVRRKARILEDHLLELAARVPSVVEVRGRGLMRGVELSVAAGPVVEEARGRGLLLAPAGTEVVRLLPPLNVRLSELERARTVLEEVLR